MSGRKVNELMEASRVAGNVTMSWIPNTFLLVVLIPPHNIVLVNFVVVFFSNCVYVGFFKKQFSTKQVVYIYIKSVPKQCALFKTFHYSIMKKIIA